MRIEQLRIFGEKGMFDSKQFETSENHEIFSKIATSVNEAVVKFSNYQITDFDNTTRANMLNNLVVKCINENCECKKFNFIKSFTNTRRSFAILEDKYIFLFKKHPVSNLKTKQDDIIKNQRLDKHVIFVVYEIDEFWSSISKIELQYFSTPTDLTYSYNITDFVETKKLFSISNSEENKPTVSVKKELIRKKKAE